MSPRIHPQLRLILDKLAESETLHSQLLSHFETILAEENIELSDTEHRQLIEQAVAVTLPGRAALSEQDIRGRVKRGIDLKYADTKERIRSLLLAEFDPAAIRPSQEETIRQQVRERVDSLVAETDLPLAEHHGLFEGIIAELLGFGLLEPLFANPEIFEIMVNSPKQVLVKTEKGISPGNAQFKDQRHLQNTVDRLLTPLGLKLDAETPFVHGYFPDGSTIYAISSDIALGGPAFMIRKNTRQTLTVDDLKRLGAFSPKMIEFLRACVVGGLNIIVVGDSGSGKTTLLNALASFIPNDERIVAISDHPWFELVLTQDNVVALKTNDTMGTIGVDDLIHRGLSLNPDRMVVDQLSDRSLSSFISMVRSKKHRLCALCGLNVGPIVTAIEPVTFTHEEPMQQIVSRLETMCTLYPSASMPVKQISETIMDAVNLIIWVERMRTGKRKVLSIMEVVGIEDDAIVTAEIFHHRKGQTSLDEGYFTATGHIPKILDHLKGMGIHLPQDMFMPQT